jgi:hypothetical protein
VDPDDPDDDPDGDDPEPGSAHPTPDPVKVAAPSPSATANPATRPTNLDALIASSRGPIIRHLSGDFILLAPSVAQVSLRLLTTSERLSWFHRRDLAGWGCRMGEVPSELG